LEVHRILGPGFREPEDYVQALNYIKSSGFKLGLLLNFGASRLQIKKLPVHFFVRFVLSNLRVSKGRETGT
jgi:hypothetical protein